MSILKVLAIAVAGAVIVLVLKNTNINLSFILRFAVIVVVFTLMLPDIKNLKEVVLGVSFPDGVSLETIKVLFKCFGLLCFGAIASDICRDNGENGLGNIVDFCAKIACVGMCLPIIIGVITTAAAFMKF